MLQFGTILSVVAVIALTQGGFLASLWFMDRRAAVVGWWASAFSVLAVGSGLAAWRAFAGELIPGAVGAALIIAAFGLIWQAVRVFDGRPAIWPALIGAPAIWLAAVALLGRAAEVGVLTVSAGLLSAAFVFAALYELWRGRREFLPSRQPLGVALVVVLASLLTQMVLGGAEDGAASADSLPYGVWLTLAGAIAISTAAALALSMSRERRQRSHDVIAALDPHTGALSLGAFLAPAARLVAAQLRVGAPVAFATIQLDGDSCEAVELRLRAIHDALMNLSRAADIVARGRAGSIAVVMPGIEAEEAAAQLRQVLAASHSTHIAAATSRPVALRREQAGPALARIGLVSSSEVGHDLRAMMLAAEAAVDDARSDEEADHADTLATYTARRSPVRRAASGWPAGVILPPLGAQTHRVGAFND